MKLSPLQKARYQYNPKLPGMLRNGIDSICVKEGKETVKNIQNDVKDHEGRIVKLEASYKAEHKRIDEVFRMASFRDGDVNE